VKWRNLPGTAEMKGAPGFVRAGLRDISISRDAQRAEGWGIPVPGDPSQVVYVWIDALSNYITALGIPQVGDEHDGRFAKYWPVDVHLIGKDILWFHAVYWPCMLLALIVIWPFWQQERFHRQARQGREEAQQQLDEMIRSALLTDLPVKEPGGTEEEKPKAKTP